MRALVTGATGFLGGRLAALLIERGWAVRAQHRPGRDAPGLAALGAELVAAALDDQAALEAACRGCDAVFHAAAAVGRAAVAPAVFRVNVDGTEAVLRAAFVAGVSRFVFTSSVAVYGDRAPAGVDEDAPPRPAGPYGESKAAAEAACVRFSRDHGLPVTILRPCFIYGPGDRNFTPYLAAIVRRGWFPAVDGGRAPVDVVHVDDAAWAHVLAAGTSQAAGRAYNVTDGRRRPVRRLVELAAGAMGVRVRLIPVPSWAAAPGAAILRAAAGALGVRGGEMITASNLRRLSAPHHYSIARARAELGFEPRHQAELAFREVLRAAPPAATRP